MYGDYLLSPSLSISIHSISFLFEGFSKGAWSSESHPINKLVSDSIGLYTVAKEKFKDSIKIFHLSSEEIDEIDKKMKVSERAKKAQWIKKKPETPFLWNGQWFYEPIAYKNSFIGREK